MIERLPVQSHENVVAGWTTRFNGYSTSPYSSNNLAFHVGDDEQFVEKNRARFQAAVDNTYQFQWLNQTHSNKAVKVVNAGPNIEADALYTKSTGLVLNVLTADCLPVFFLGQCNSQKTTSEIAVAHAGWRGLLNGILENTVALFESNNEAIRAYAGPAIGVCHFEVGEEVKDLFVDASSEFEDVEACFRPLGGSKYLCDIAGIAKLRLSRLGIDLATNGNQCTVCDSDRFFSYRKEGITGRMTNFIAITPAVD